MVFLFRDELKRRDGGRAFDRENWEEWRGSNTRMPAVAWEKQPPLILEEAFLAPCTSFSRTRLIMPIGSLPDQCWRVARLVFLVSRRHR